MPITIPRATLERGWPRLSARGALAAAPASIPNTAVRIFPVIALDLEVYTSDCMLKVQMGGLETGQEAIDCGPSGIGGILNPFVRLPSGTSKTSRSLLLEVSSST